VARRATDALAGARCVIVPGAGHTVHLEAPDAFAEALASYWNVTPAPDRAETATP